MSLVWTFYCSSVVCLFSFFKSWDYGFCCILVIFHLLLFTARFFTVFFFIVFNRKIELDICIFHWHFFSKTVSLSNLYGVLILHLKNMKTLLQYLDLNYFLLYIMLYFKSQWWVSGWRFVIRIENEQNCILGKWKWKLWEIASLWLDIFTLQGYRVLRA